MQDTPGDAPDPYEAAHRRSIRHRGELERSTRCGCFHCLAEFPPSEIRTWTDDATTALCPRCGIDSVIGDGELAFDHAFLTGMRARWFG